MLDKRIKKGRQRKYNEEKHAKQSQKRQKGQREERKSKAKKRLKEFIDDKDTISEGGKEGKIERK